MAAVLSPKSLSFPHNILQDTRDPVPFMRMERTTLSRPSLPPISSLMKDLDKHTETASISPSLNFPRIQSTTYPRPLTPEKLPSISTPRTGMPPTPPLPGTSSFDFPRHNSNDSASPAASGTSNNGYFNHSPKSSHREAFSTKSSYPPIPETHHWSASSSPKSRYSSDESNTDHLMTGTNTDTTYSERERSTSPYLGLSQQRPLPGNFPPTLPTGQQLPSIDPQMSAAQYQQHHHHYSNANSPSYAPSTDRYQCSTCQKAFSRPSSLKIHSYSHTGEKPFKCKYEGCGKYFSVRSNMKRHEKGCHGVETSSNGGSSPKAI